MNEPSKRHMPKSISVPSALRLLQSFPVVEVDGIGFATVTGIEVPEECEQGDFLFSCAVTASVENEGGVEIINFYSVGFAVLEGSELLIYGRPKNTKDEMEPYRLKLYQPVPAETLERIACEHAKEVRKK